jgi:hypothetical protein
MDYRFPGGDIVPGYVGCWAGEIGNLASLGGSVC